MNLNRWDAPKVRNSNEKIDGAFKHSGVSVHYDQIAQNEFRGFELLNIFKALEDRRKMVELPGPGKGTDDKVVGIESGIRVVDSEGVDKNI